MKRSLSPVLVAQVHRMNGMDDDHVQTARRRMTSFSTKRFLSQLTQRKQTVIQKKNNEKKQNRSKSHKTKLKPHRTEYIYSARSLFSAHMY